MRSWIRRFRVAFEELGGRLSPPPFQHRFFIVSAAYNASEFVERCLDSVARQVYPTERVTQLVFDDASEDGTADRVEAFARAHPERRIELVRNEHNRGGCANLTEGFRRAPAGSIVLQVDGDDWLPDPRVLAFLNRSYADSSLWMTYNTWRFPDGRGSVHSVPLSPKVVAEGTVRSAPWTTSHLHSFRAELFAHVREEDLKDPETGEYWRASVDMAHYLPMLELAGTHARHVDRVTYVYNLHSNSIISKRREEQLACERRIRAQSPYRPLDALT